MSEPGCDNAMEGAKVDRRPTHQFDGPHEFSDNIRECLRLLEELCDDPGLRLVRGRDLQHPAVSIYDQLVEVIAQEKVPVDREQFITASVYRLMLDRSTWGSGQAEPGFLRRSCDEETYRFIVCRARQAHTFDDVVTELFFCGWLQSKGFDAQLVEHEGMPDIKITTNSQFWAEVKCVRKESTANRIRKTLSEANDQLKEADPHKVGIVFVRIDRAIVRETVSDSIPADVQARITEIQRTLRGNYCKSVAYVVLTWDDFDIIQGKTNGTSLHVARRRSVVLKHSNPRATSPVQADEIEVGVTTMQVIEYGWINELLADPRSDVTGLRDEVIEFTDRFDQLRSELPDLRRADVLKVFRKPDSMWFATMADVAVIIATQLVNVSKNPFVLIAVANRTGPDPVVQVDAAYRLYGEKTELARLAEDPFEAFLTLLRRYPLSIRIGRAEGVLIPYTTVDLVVDRMEPLIARESSVAEPFISVGLRSVLEPSPQVHCAWAYGIDLGAYKVDLRSRRK